MGSALVSRQRDRMMIGRAPRQELPGALAARNDAPAVAHHANHGTGYG